ncbi:MAG: hypothetical protein GY711_20185 [bacterium]|nr:hypothetical protein [bacterium]
MSAPTTPRPELLTAGLVLSAVHAMITAVLCAIGGLWMLAASASTFNPADFGLLPIVAFSLGAVVVAGMAVFYVFLLYVCWRAWHGSRPWLWAAVIFSGIGLVNTGPISAVISVVTIVGAMQWLERMPREHTAVT